MDVVQKSHTNEATVEQKQASRRQRNLSMDLRQRVDGMDEHLLVS
jgi:hypothetical protein